MLKAHYHRQKTLYALVIFWAICGALLPSVVAIGVSLVTFILLFRSNDFTKVLLAFTTLLIYSDSRAGMFEFAVNAKIGFILLFALLVISKWKHLKNRSNKLFRYFLPFLIFGIITSFWSHDFTVGIQKSISYGLVFFLVPLVVNAAADKEYFGLDMILYFLVFLTAGLVINLILPDFATLIGRYRGLLGNPNGLGIFLTILYTIYYQVNSKIGLSRKNRNLHFLFLIVFTVSLLLTGSRTSIFALGVFLMFMQLRHFSNVFMVVFFIGFVISYQYLLSALPSVVQSLGLEEYFRLETLEEGSGRFVAWNFAWEKIQEVYFTGGGFGYTEFIYRFNFRELSRLGHQGNAHNSYLTIWLNTGLIGLALYIIGLIRSLLDCSWRSSLALPILFSILFSSFFESWLSASLNPFTPIFLISFTLLFLDKSSGSPKKESLDQEEVPPNTKSSLQGHVG